VDEIPTHRTWRKPSGGLSAFGGLLNADRTVSEAGHRLFRRPEPLSGRGATIYSRSLAYRNKVVRLPGGAEHSYLSGEEQGIDGKRTCRIAAPEIRFAPDTEPEVRQYGCVPWGVR